MMRLAKFSIEPSQVKMTNPKPCCLALRPLAAKKSEVLKLTVKRSRKYLTRRLVREKTLQNEITALPPSEGRSGNSGEKVSPRLGIIDSITREYGSRSPQLRPQALLRFTPFVEGSRNLERHNSSQRRRKHYLWRRGYRATQPNLQ